VWEKVGKGGCEREGVFEKVGEREREERMRERVCVRERGGGRMRKRM
jgi:hypothetical protein